MSSLALVMENGLPTCILVGLNKRIVQCPSIAKRITSLAKWEAARNLHRTSTFRTENCQHQQSGDRTVITTLYKNCKRTRERVNLFDWPNKLKVEVMDEVRDDKSHLIQRKVLAETDPPTAYNKNNRFV